MAMLEIDIPLVVVEEAIRRKHHLKEPVMVISSEVDAISDVIALKVEVDDSEFFDVYNPLDWQQVVVDDIVEEMF